MGRVQLVVVGSGWAGLAVACTRAAVRRSRHRHWMSGMQALQRLDS